MLKACISEAISSRGKKIPERNSKGKQITSEASIAVFSLSEKIAIIIPMDAKDSDINPATRIDCGRLYQLIAKPKASEPTI